jgi:hypothetical protein
LKRDPDYLQFRPYKAIVASPIRGRPSLIGGGRSNLVDFAVRSEPGRRGRSRVLYLVLAVAVIGAGLLWRSSWLSLPAFLAKYGGGALWALMVFLFCGFLMPRVRTWVVTVAALVISYGVEFGQLYHAPWIDHLRAYPLGALILGSTFAWPDLLAYTIGIFIGASLERALRKRETESWL